MPVITFANSKGGAGKTTSALILSQVLSHHGATVTLIDADPNQPLKNWSEIDPSRIPETLTFEAGVTEDTILNVIDEASQRDSFVIIDLEGSKNVTVSYAIGRSDLVIIPIQGSQLDANEAAIVIELIDREKKAFGREISNVVLFSRSSVIQARDVKHIKTDLLESGVDVLPVELMEKSAFRTIFQLGGSIYDLTANEVASPDVAIANAEAFAKAVTSKLEQGTSTNE